MFKLLSTLFKKETSIPAFKEEWKLVGQIDALSPNFERLSDEALWFYTGYLRLKLAAYAKQDAGLEELLPEAFAALREATGRATGKRQNDIQLLVGILLHKGRIANVPPDEDANAAILLTAYLYALTGNGVHIIAFNSFQARRSAQRMAQVAAALGLTVGVLQEANTRTENGRKAYIVDITHEAPHEDTHLLRLIDRREVYKADIIYGTYSEFGFDYLRDHMANERSLRVQCGHYYAIINEIDHILIDEARTPLTISSPSAQDTTHFVQGAWLARQLVPGDYEINSQQRTVTITETGEFHLEELLGQALRDRDHSGEQSEEQNRLLQEVLQALRAEFFYQRNKHYRVQHGKIEIVDVNTGRVLSGQVFFDGLYQALEAKEGLEIHPPLLTYASITVQNYFRMYQKLAGISSTALDSAEEFQTSYHLCAVPVPSNLAHQASRPSADLLEIEEKDDSGYRFKYYVRRSDPERRPLFFRRKDYPDVVYRTSEVKLRALTQEILTCYVLGRPVLIGTTSVEFSERLSERLRPALLQKLALVWLVRSKWLYSNQRSDDGMEIPALKWLDIPLSEIPDSELRRACRTLEMPVVAHNAANLTHLHKLLDLPSDAGQRLHEALVNGVPHRALLAHQTADEQAIYASAGTYGAVTIVAQNTWRGMEVLLGGEPPADIVAQVARLLGRSDIRYKVRQGGLPDFDQLARGQWGQALALLDESDLRSRADAVKEFQRHLESAARVRALGGLHVIGSERHEARRIDDQLRNLAGQQGDPGSSRFYLSMEDNLLILFGGEQANTMMRNLHVDDELPLEIPLIGRLIEQSQSRVESANLNNRKRLVEFDNILNQQRTALYARRERIFDQTDFSAEMIAMLREEILDHYPIHTSDRNALRRLVSWLDWLQPFAVSDWLTQLESGSKFVPVFCLSQIYSHFQGRLGQARSIRAAQDILLEIARLAINAEHELLYQALAGNLWNCSEHMATRSQEYYRELDSVLERIDEAIKQENVRPAEELVGVLSQALHTPFRLTKPQIALLNTQPQQLADELRRQIQDNLHQQTILQLPTLLRLRSLRLDDMEIHTAQLAKMSWDDPTQQMLQQASALYHRRADYLLRSDSPGQIGYDLNETLHKTASLTTADIYLLLWRMQFGVAASYNKRLHRRVKSQTQRLNYIYLVANLMASHTAESIRDQALAHFKNVLAAQRAEYGKQAWPDFAPLHWSQLDDQLQARLQERLGPAQVGGLNQKPLESLPAAAIASVQEELGQRVLDQAYRSLLLNVIYGHWAEYQTKMEVIRKSFLSSQDHASSVAQYAQRADELFANFDQEVRRSVAPRMLHNRAKQIVPTEIGLRASLAAPPLVDPAERTAGAWLKFTDSRLSRQDWASACYGYRQALYLARLEDNNEMETLAQQRIAQVENLLHHPQKGKTL